jgi:hypothetical protein
MFPPPPPRTSSRRNTNPQASRGLGWIVPVDDSLSEKRENYRSHPQTIGQRIQATITDAVSERNKYRQKALSTGLALNIAIGLQVFLGALTTGLASATTGHRAQVATSILGGLATLVASYLARARGSGEPELSTARCKDLDQFLREVRAFHDDHEHETGHTLDEEINRHRKRLEELLGNTNRPVSEKSPV